MGKLRACCTNSHYDTGPRVQGVFDQCTASEPTPVVEAIRITTADSCEVPKEVQEVIYRNLDHGQPGALMAKRTSEP